MICKCLPQRSHHLRASFCCMFQSHSICGRGLVLGGRSEGKEAWEGVGAEPPGSIHSSVEFPIIRALFSGEFHFSAAGSSHTGAYTPERGALRCRSRIPNCGESPWGRWAWEHPSVHSPAAVACMYDSTFIQVFLPTSFVSCLYIAQNEDRQKL